MTGITAYGAYVPKFRIKVDEIARVWEKNGKKISRGLGLTEKAVASMEEDACTLAVEAARDAISDFEIDPQKIGALYVGSESHPYAVKPTASIVADAIEAGPELTAADLEFACKAGTAGMQMCYAMVKSGMIDYGMSIGSDTAQGKPNDTLEFTAGSGAGAVIIGNNNVIAKINDTCSYTTDTPDFWRRQHQEFPEHGGRFTGKPAYFKHVINGAKMIMGRNNMNAEDFKHVVFHQPNAKFPKRTAKKLGFGMEQIKQGLLIPYIGNTYSGSSIIGLCSILDKAEPGDKILCVSYGSGAGSDAFILTATGKIKNNKTKIPVMEMIKNKEYIDYALYAKHRNKLKGL